jgi:hypothetical protein
MNEQDRNRLEQIAKTTCEYLEHEGHNRLSGFLKKADLEFIDDECFGYGGVLVRFPLAETIQWGHFIGRVKNGISSLLKERMLHVY